MAVPLPPRYRLLDLVFALVGTLAFLVDLGNDVWSAVNYYLSGDTAWAALLLGLYALSSSVLQLLSWGWFWVDRRADEAHVSLESIGGSGGGAEQDGHCAGNGGSGYDEEHSVAGQAVSAHIQLGNRYPDHTTMPTCMGTSGCSVATAPSSKCSPEDMSPWHTSAHAKAESVLSNSAGTQSDPTNPAPPGTGRESTKGHSVETFICWQPSVAHHTDEEPSIKHFHTSRIILWPSCLTLLHVLQLGYPLRCIHSLEVGIAAYRSPKYSIYQEYAYFLTHDISMMRLVETFLENTPQLILLLYIINEQETIYPFQWFSISVSFISISWAILDYHQSLRLFLKDKVKLNCLSSFIYYLWNFFLISSRIVCIAFFTITFQWLIAVHFLMVWFTFFIWAWVQETDFMKSTPLEFFYRATVAIILYFSWFNIADGRTIYRCIVYYAFITTDSMLLLLSWKFLKFPSILDEHETLLLISVGVCFIVGLLLRWLYYKLVHPNVGRESKQYYDETDGMYKMFVPAVKAEIQNNKRMLYLAQKIC